MTNLSSIVILLQLVLQLLSNSSTAQNPSTQAMVKTAMGYATQALASQSTTIQPSASSPVTSTPPISTVAPSCSLTWGKAPYVAGNVIFWTLQGMPTSTVGTLYVLNYSYFVGGLSGWRCARSVDHVSRAVSMFQPEFSIPKLVIRFPNPPILSMEIIRPYLAMLPALSHKSSRRFGMPAEIARYSSFGPRRLAIRQAAAPPTKRCAKIVIEIEILHSIVAILANKIPDDAPISSKVRGDIFDNLTLPAQLPSYIPQVMQADVRHAFWPVDHKGIAGYPDH